MSSPGRITVETQEHVARVTIDNERRRNAVGYEMWRQLGEAMVRLSVDDAVRVAVLAGAGGKAFSAGADISEFEHWRSDPVRAEEYGRVSGDACRALEGFPKPTIAKIQGHCIGGGFELALLCDIRVCAPDARFAVTPARLGIGYDLDDTRLLVSRLGAPAAREILFTARAFTAEEALRLGIVNRIATAGGLDAAVAEYAGQIAANAPLTLRAAKAIIAQAEKPRAEQDVALCAQLVRACYESEDYLEGRSAFAEKRPPDFTGS